jgi:hypothetical protein
MLSSKKLKKTIEIFPVVVPTRIEHPAILSLLLPSGQMQH